MKDEGRISDAATVLVVYITASSRGEAMCIAETLISEKLAACVNILGGITSIYEWEGTLEHSDEVALIAKTTEAGFDLLEQRVKELHSYECPCVVAMRIEKGHGPFLDWIRHELKK